MINLSGKFRYFLCTDNVTLRFRHRGLREYIKGKLHIATPVMAMSTSSCHVTSADSESITSTIMEKSSRKRSYMHTGSLIPSFWMRASMCTTFRGLVSFTCSKVSSGRKKTSILMSMKTRKSMVKSCKNQCDFVSII